MTTDTFDHADRLNDDGTVTFRIIPSNWRCVNLSPDTYHLFSGEVWAECEYRWWQEENPDRDVSRDLDITYDHASILQALAQELTDWLAETLADAGLSTVSTRLVDTWSPKYYNFQSDGFDVEITCDPAELRQVSEGFDVDEWASTYYGSVDGFHSYIPGRMRQDSWRADYDGEFRVESILAALDDGEREGWMYRLWKAESEIYSEHTEIRLLETARHSCASVTHSHYDNDERRDNDRVEDERDDLGAGTSG